MNFSFDRKIEVNSWIIKARWFYVGGILLIGFLTKIISESNVSFSYSSMALIAVAFIVINLFFYLDLQKIKKTKSSLGLTILSSLEISAELIVFIYIMHLAGGIESISPVFFFMPIVSSSLIFGARGAIITALVSALLINLLVVFEYFGVIPHVVRYGVDTLEFKSLSISLTKTVTISIFYLIIGWFSGYGSKLFLSREDALEENKRQADEQAKKLVKQSQELIASNEERDKKIKEMEKFQKLSVGRELKMMELKKEIEKLKNKPEAEPIISLNNK